MTMAEATTNMSDTISRQALGRIAGLGDLYDARTDTFCGTNMFEQLPPDSPAVSKTDIPRMDASITIGRGFHEQLRGLDVKGELKLSVLSGMVELGGCAKYLNRERSSFNSVEGTLICKTTTVHESLNLYNAKLKQYISLDALSHPTATHVVVQIYWGANCAITVTDRNSENNTKKEVEGNLMLHLEKLQQLFSAAADANAQYNKEENDSWNKFSLEIVGDVLPANFPHTLDGALSMIRNFRQLIQKGQPITYMLFPLSCPSFQKYIDLRNPNIQTVRNLANEHIVRVIQLFDYITELRQQVYDKLAEMSNNIHCVTSGERQQACSLENDLEVLQTGVKSDLARLLREVRSANTDGQCPKIESFCQDHQDSADEKFHEFESIFNTVQPRIEFAKRCYIFGATYLQHPLDERIASACDSYKNVYVLLLTDADAETTKRNRSAFIELARNYQLDSTTNCYFTWIDSTEDTKIEHYRKHKRVHEDVAKQLDTKNMAVCIPAPIRANRLMPFTARCPNGDCNKEERSWTCRDCCELLEFCPRNGELYCSCGHAKVNRFQFRCCSEAHDFAHFGDNKLHKLVALLTSRSGNYFFVGDTQHYISHRPQSRIFVENSDFCPIYGGPRRNIAIRYSMLLLYTLLVLAKFY